MPSPSLIANAPEGEAAQRERIAHWSILAIAVACCASAYAQTLTGTARITDADTLVIGSERIRLQGVDAPELDQICLDRTGEVWTCGIDARDRLIRHIGSRQTSCITNGKDAFGRWRATCSTNEGDLSAWLVRQGFGMAFIRYSGAYVAEKAMARSAQKGMWAGAFIAPWDWRTRTASTAILGSYKPTEEQERLLLLPSTPQLQPKLPLSPRPQSQEQTAECLIKGNINPKGERIYHVPGQRYYDKTTINLSLHSLGGVSRSDEGTLIICRASRNQRPHRALSQ